VLGLVIKRLIEALDHATGLSRWGLISSWPLGAQFLLFLVTHDLYIYVFHRCQHRVPLLWRVHEAHHSPRQVDWLSGTRSHALEILINQTIEFAPLVLLGAAPQMALIKATVDAVWGMYIHANLDVRTGWLQRVINGPEMHRWHHANEVVDVNFSTKLAFWDWIFGTAHLPPTKPRGYGVREGGMPEGYFAQQLYAFRVRRRDTARV
jgi:sterol desaturase/sphingolipid hydroxylase (fatty acid hydroxylase superfamily)